MQLGQHGGMNPPLLPGGARRRLYVFLKITSICLLVGLLHIPLAMTHGVLVERRTYQADATAAIASTWGGEQRLVGPILAVPYEYETKVLQPRAVDGKVVQGLGVQTVSATAYFLPEVLAVNGTAVPEIRRRGIYGVVVYNASLRFTGRFRPDFAAAGIEATQIDWPKARVFFGISDVRGIRSVGPITLGAGEAPFEPSDGSAGAMLPLVAKATVKPGEAPDFALSLEAQGSRRLAFAPVGKATTVALESAWPDPSFDGGALPVERRVSGQGFTARWQSSHLSRGFPQHWSDRQVNADDFAKRIEPASFGVRFAQPVDGYSTTERAQKYGTLFFVLTFTVFFLFEATAALRIHWLQYAIVGAALCLFFLGFLALSEFWPTAVAYAVAAAACTLMISLYSHTFLRTGRRTLLIGGGLGVTYAYLYFVLRSQDYALIAGTAALFLALALVMYCTRRIDWAELDLSESPRP
jgi:inner membrane protein